LLNVKKHWNAIKYREKLNLPYRRWKNFDGFSLSSTRQTDRQTDRQQTTFS